MASTANFIGALSYGNILELRPAESAAKELDADITSIVLTNGLRRNVFLLTSPDSKERAAGGVVIERRSPEARGSQCCQGCLSWLKAVGVALLVLLGAAAVAAGVSVVLAAAGISVLGSAAIAAPLIAKVGVLWSYVIGSAGVAAGLAAAISGFVSCCRQPTHVDSTDADELLLSPASPLPPSSAAADNNSMTRLASYSLSGHAGNAGAPLLPPEHAARAGAAVQAT